MKTLTINGLLIDDIPSFYKEINRVLMTGEDWKLGESLDALDDALYGGYGAIEGAEPVRIEWLHMERNRSDLGVEATRGWYRDKLARPEQFDADLVSRDLVELEAGRGGTYFDLVLEIILQHPNIELVEA